MSVINKSAVRDMLIAEANRVGAIIAPEYAKKTQVSVEALARIEAMTLLAVRQEAREAAHRGGKTV